MTICVLWEVSGLRGCSVSITRCRIISAKVFCQSGQKHYNNMQRLPLSSSFPDPSCILKKPNKFLWKVTLCHHQIIKWPRGKKKTFMAFTSCFIFVKSQSGNFSEHTESLLSKSRWSQAFHQNTEHFLLMWRCMARFSSSHERTGIHKHRSLKVGGHSYFNISVNSRVIVPDCVNIP